DERRYLQLTFERIEVGDLKLRPSIDDGCRSRVNNGPAFHNIYVYRSLLDRRCDLDRDRLTGFVDRPVRPHPEQFVAVAEVDFVLVRTAAAGLVLCNDLEIEIIVELTDIRPRNRKSGGAK